MAVQERLISTAGALINNRLIKEIALGQPSGIERRLARALMPNNQEIDRLRLLMGGNVFLAGSFRHGNTDKTPKERAESAAERIYWHTSIGPRGPQKLRITPLMPATQLGGRSHLHDDADLLQSTLRRLYEVEAEVDPLPSVVGDLNTTRDRGKFHAAILSAWTELPEPDTVQVFTVEPPHMQPLLRPDITYPCLKDGGTVRLNGIVNTRYQGAWEPV